MSNRANASWIHKAALYLGAVLVALTVLLCADASFAQTTGDPTTPTAATGTTGTTAGATVSDCHNYVGVSNKIAGCILASLDQATGTFFTGFYPYVSDAIAAIMVLGIAFYGVMIAFSMVENVGRDTIMLIVKIGLVTYCTTNTDTLYYTVIDMMNAGGAAVIQTVPASGAADGTTDFANITCLTNMRNASETNGKPVTGPWLAIDCMLDTVIGIQVPGADGSTDTSVTNTKLATGNNGMSRGLLFFFMSGMQTSVVGLILGVIGMLFIWSLIMLTLKALVIFLSGYLAVAFLMIISPLFIPLILLPGDAQSGARSYFDKWVKLLISYALQPVMMLAFVSLFISAVDLAMFSSDYSVAYRLAGDASRQSGFDINQYLTTNSAIIKKPIMLWEQKVGNVSPNIQKQAQDMANSAISDTPESKCEQGVFTGTTDEAACKNVKPVSFYRNALDWDALAAVRTPAVTLEDDATTAGQELSREVISASIFCAVILFVMNKFASVVPDLVANLVGSSNIRNVSLANNLVLPGGSQPRR